MERWRLAWAVLWILPLALFWDFSRFITTYYSFHEQAMAGVEQLTAPAHPSEVIVVLTGDIGSIPRALLPTVAADSERWAAFRTALDTDAIAAMRYRIKI